MCNALVWMHDSDTVMNIYVNTSFSLWTLLRGVKYYRRTLVSILLLPPASLHPSRNNSSKFHHCASVYYIGTGGVSVPSNSVTPELQSAVFA
jgi:hypothetical protein